MIRTASTGMNRLVAQVCEREIGLRKGNAASKGTLCRKNFSKESEDATNAHLVMEFYASMSYLAITPTSTGRTSGCTASRS